MQGKIVTVTLNPSLDKSTTIDRVNPDQKLRCNPPRFEPGGGGINVSRATRRLGGESLALYTCGGPAGELFQDLLEEEGVQHPVSIEDYTRENFTVLEGSSTHQYRFNMPGPMLREEEWQHGLDELARLDPPPDYVVASGSLPRGVPEGVYARLARRAKEKGWRYILDTSGEELRLAAEEGVFLLKPNMRELGHLAGEEIRSEAHQEEVARSLVEKGQAEVVIVSLGAAGALLVTAGESERIRAPTVRIRSKIGAGDSMIAGIVLALARGWSLREAAHFGVAAGSAAVKTPGTELCRKEDTEQLYERMMQD